MNNNATSKQKIEYISDEFFLPSILDVHPYRSDDGLNQDVQEPIQTNSSLQTQVGLQQKLTFSQESLANHYLQVSLALRQINTQQSFVTQVPLTLVEELEILNTTKNFRQKQMVKHASTNSLAQSQQFQEIKGNVKNAYIKKITSLLNFRTEKIELKNESSSECSSMGEEQLIYKSLKNKGILGSTQDLVSLERKNLKMKDSAKKSRLRKKVYITMLENKIQEIQEKMEKYKLGIEDSVKFVETVCSQNDSIGSLVMGQAQIKTQIDRSLNKSEEVEGLQLVLDSYQMRFGVSGVKRKQYIKYCFMNLGRLLLQSNYGPLLFAAGKFQNTRSEEFNDYIKEFKSLCDIKDENIIYKLLAPINLILDHKERHESLIKGLAREINQLIKSQMQLEIVISNINQILTPQQQAILIDECQKPRHIEQIQQDEFHSEDNFLDFQPYKKVCL